MECFRSIMAKTNLPYRTMSASSQSLGRCCFCIPLRVGCLISAYLDLVFNISLVYVYGGIAASNFYIEATTPATSYTPSSIASIFLQPSLRGLAYLEMEAVLVFMLINLVWIGNIVVSVIGLHKKRPLLLRIFTGLSIFRLIVVFCAVIYVLTDKLYLPPSIISYVISVVLSVYQTVCCYVYARHLDRERETHLMEAYPINDELQYIAELEDKTLVA